MNEGLFTNEKLIAAAREWVTKRGIERGAIPSDFDNSDMLPQEAFAGVEAHYDGGLAQFIKDNEGKPTTSTEEMLDMALRALVVVGYCEGIVFENEWESGGITAEQKPILLAAIDEKASQMKRP